MHGSCREPLSRGLHSAQVHRDLRIAEVEKERRLRVLTEDEHATMLAATEVFLFLPQNNPPPHVSIPLGAPCIRSVG